MIKAFKLEKKSLVIDIIYIFIHIFYYQQNICLVIVFLRQKTKK